MSVESYLYNPTLTTPPVSVVATGDKQQFNISWAAKPGSKGYRVYAGFDPFNIRSLISGATLVAGTGFTFDAPVYPPAQTVYFWVASVDTVEGAKGPVGATGVTGGTMAGAVGAMGETGATGATGGTGATGSTGTPPGRGGPGGPGGPEVMSWINTIGSDVFKTAQTIKFNSTSTPLSEDSQMIMAGCDQLYYFEEMRRRSKAISEDAGEEAILFIKQWIGLPDPTTQEELDLDPNNQGMSRSDETYGVGIYPGFFPGIHIRIRFGGLPASMFEYQSSGLRPLLDNEAWTLWEPLMHENDLIVRVGTGQRYVVKQVSFSNYRGIPLTQRMTLSIVNPTSPLSKLTDVDLRTKWANIDSIAYSRMSFGVMPSRNPENADYLIFG